jgi:predicted transcriptional regulator
VRDEPAETLIAEIWWLHRALADRLAQVEADHVSVSADLETVSGTRDPDAAIAERAATIARAAAEWRAKRKAQLQALRRVKRAYEVALGMRAPPNQARPPTVTEAGRKRIAVQSVGPEGVRSIEGGHAGHTNHEP